MLCIDRGDPADGRMVCKGTEDHQRRFHGTGAAGAVPSAFGPARHKGTGDRAASGGKPGLEAGCDSEWDILGACIRVSLEFGGILGDFPEESEEEEHDRLERIQELCAGIRFCDGWVEGEDGYYYYQEAVAPGSIVQICEQVTIPEGWDNEIAEKLFTIEVSAEAIHLDGREAWF